MNFKVESHSAQYIAAVPQWVTAFLMVLAGVGCSPFDSKLENMSLENGTASDYIVVLNDVSDVARVGAMSKADATITTMGAIALSHDLDSPSVVFSRVLQGGVYRLTPQQAEKMKSDGRVKYIELDRRVSISAMQSQAPWGLDRLDQESLPLDRVYSSPEGGAAVNAYVIDTGINIRHSDFQGRATSGFDFVDSDADATDCNGHGTHVAGTIGAANYGVAKSAKLIGVRVLDCQGSGSYSGVIAGIEWVTANHVKPAVANMSLGGGASQAIDDAIRASIRAGVTYVVAAGNENRDACFGSPARVFEAITVGSTTNTDTRSSFSNFGSCVDLFAPGSDILSTWHTSNTATQTISGTSMASPHVAGVVALMLARNPNLTPSEVANEMVQQSRSAKLSNVGSNSPNRLLSMSFLMGESGIPELKSGAPASGLGGLKGSEQFFVVNVPANSKSVEIQISGGTGDADLYTKMGDRPTAKLYDCRPYSGGNSETCRLTASQIPVGGGQLYIRLHAYSNYTGVKLSAVVSP